MLDLTQSELQALAGLLDAGVRQVGIRALTDDTLSVFKKIEAAAQAIQNPIPQESNK